MCSFTDMIFVCDEIATSVVVTAAVAFVFVGVMSFVFAVRIDE